MTTVYDGGARTPLRVMEGQPNGQPRVIVHGQGGNLSLTRMEAKELRDILADIVKSWGYED